MNTLTVNAIYENGILRPLGSLDLPENSEVELDVKIVETKNGTQETIEELLVRKGLSFIRKSTKAAQRLSDKERRRLSRVFSSSQPLGDLINEDREERF